MSDSPTHNPAEVVASGPVHKNAVTPYRIVLLRWPNGNLSTHTEYLRADGGGLPVHLSYEHGHYFTRKSAVAVKHFLQRVKDRADNYPDELAYLLEGLKDDQERHDPGGPQGQPED